MIRSRTIAIALVLGCGSTEAPTPWSEEWLANESERYIGDGDYRRETMLDSLQNPENAYSQTRFSSYARGESGWDLLPEWNPRSEPVTADTVANLAAGDPLEVNADPLWDGETPSSAEEWIALGRRVFEGYPLRAEPLAEWALAEEGAGATFGFQQAADGTYPGLRVMTDVNGENVVGITCALCHGDVEDDGVVLGRARRSFDYGALWLAANEDLGIDTEPDLAARLASWGPGRADISEDTDEDPVAIPDLWGLRYQTSLTQAGTLKHLGPTTLAIRQETQLTHANHQRTRPPRVLTWALARFLYSLAPPERDEEPDDVSEGEEIFRANCGHCHSNEAFGGELVPVEVIGTDRALATGAGRGTGFYRPPSLLAVADNAPYFHHGAVPSLEDLFSPLRLEPDYAGSPLGPGPVEGHEFGLRLNDDDRAALLGYLGSL